MIIKTLSIQIPTFNRNNYLIECLESLIESIKYFKKNNLSLDIEKFISINIFDNNNNDTLRILLKSYLEIYPFINYRYNGGNIGSDRNIIQCYNLCAADYCHVLGDDDSVNIAYIQDIYFAINSGEDYAMIYLKAYSYRKNKFILPNIFFQKNKEYNSYEFLEKLNIKLTFISSLVLKKDYQFNNYENNLHSGLVQLLPISELLIKNKKYLVLKKYYIIAKANNNQITQLDDDLNKKEVHVENNLVKIYCSTFFYILKEYHLTLSRPAKTAVLSKFFFYELIIRKKNILDFLNEKDIITYFSDTFYFKLLSRINNEKILKCLVFSIMVTKRMLSNELYKIIFSLLIQNVNGFYQQFIVKYQFIKNKIFARLGKKYFINVFVSDFSYTFTAGCQTLIKFDSIESGNLLFNNSNYKMNSNPEYSFIPNIAGHYLITSQLQFEKDSCNASCDIFRNGHFYKRGILGNNQSSYISSVVYLNGKNDYVQLFVYSSESNKLQQTGPSQNYFQAVLL